MARPARKALVCDRCGARNYKTKKKTSKSDGPLTLKKYCPKCNQHTQHRESK